MGSIPELGRPPGGGHGNPLQYSCLENPHGQRNLMGYSPKGPKESDTTEVTKHSTAQAPKVKAEQRGLKQDFPVKCQISSSI